MSWVAVGVGTATVAAGAMSANAAKKGAAAQGAAAERAGELSQEQYDISRADAAPFLRTGTAANRNLAKLLGIGTLEVTPEIEALAGPKPTEEEEWERYDAAHMARFGIPVPRGEQQQAHVAAAVAKRTEDWQARAEQLMRDRGMSVPGLEESPLLRRFTQADLEADPVYKSGLNFGLKEGTDAINARAIAGGGYDSGATLKALTRFGNDYGSTKANESYNRFVQDQNSIYNKLSGVSGAGQVASQQIQAAGVNAANQAGEALTGAGNARAAGIVGSANAWGNAAQGVGGAATYYQNNQILQRLLAQRNTPSGVLTTAQYNAMAPS